MFMERAAKLLHALSRLTAGYLPKLRGKNKGSSRITGIAPALWAGGVFLGIAGQMNVLVLFVRYNCRCLVRRVGAPACGPCWRAT